MTVQRIDRLPQITPQLDAELRDNSPEMHDHMRRLHVSLREWYRDYSLRMNALANSLDRPLAQNILVNGSMQVWQRGTSFASAASRVTTADRWQSTRGGGVAGATISRQTGNNPSQYCARVQRDSANASTQIVYFSQNLTTNNSYPLRGKRLGLRFAARQGADFSASSSALGVQVQTGTGTDQNVLAGFTGQTATLNSSATLTTSWQYFSFDVGVIDASITQVAVLFSFTPVGTASTNDYFEIQEVQLVQTLDSNVDVSDYPWRSFEEELAACLPYYEKSFDYETAPAQNAGSAGADWFRQWDGTGASQYAPGVIKYKAIKRGTVTTTIYNPSAANAQFRNFTRTADWSGCALAQATRHAFFPSGTSDVGSAAGDLILFHWTADAEL